MDGDFIGVTVCDECQTRLKLRNKHETLIGKTVRCPKCHALFTCNVQKPSSVESAAMQNEEEKNGMTETKKASSLKGGNS